MCSMFSACSRHSRQRWTLRLAARGTSPSRPAPSGGATRLTFRSAAQAVRTFAVLVALALAFPSAAAELRVCADPNNLPFSNRAGEGFENDIARIVAGEMHRELVYTWWPQRRGFARNTLRANRCDVIMGIPSAYELAQPTAPYYRSTYVFVTRRDRKLRISSLDDPVLRKLRIGIHAIGDDYANVPPAQALASRGLVRNIVGYSIYGDYSKPNPPARLIEAVASGDVDVAIAWGPLAGYFASKQKPRLTVTPLSPQIDLPFLPFVFDIAMGVRRGDNALRDELERAIAHRKADIDAVLRRYHVPLVGDE